ncbi:MAG: aldolase catalytic domain-containing protein [Fimbriimonadaceae bacterium]|nr:aldolase catalytic domain-containing protein [Fimbriimonadaceae bacterium]
MSDTQSQSTSKGTWVTYRPEIKVLDCTIRDGGLMNDHRFEDGFVKAIYDCCVAAGVDYMEFGYKADQKIYSRDKFGDWKFCVEDDVRRIVGDNPTELKLTMMADAERTDYHHDILPCEASVFDVVRVATYVHQIPTAIAMIQDATDKGYETTVNIMAASTVQENDLDDALAALAATPVGTIYLVDSFGAMYSEEIQYLTRKYQRAVEGTNIEIGIHTHNNLQLAYANTVEAIVLGVNRLDATVAGLGRGAGNCPLELLLGFLKNPKYHLRPVLECLETAIPRLRTQMKWGYDLAYMITGQLNCHPRDAMKYMEVDEPGSIVAFYDQMLEGTS